MNFSITSFYIYPADPEGLDIYRESSTGTNGMKIHQGYFPTVGLSQPTVGLSQPTIGLSQPTEPEEHGLHGFTKKVLIRIIENASRSGIVMKHSWIIKSYIQVYPGISDKYRHSIKNAHLQQSQGRLPGIPWQTQGLQ